MPQDPREFLLQLAFAVAIEKVVRALGDIPAPVSLAATMSFTADLAGALGIDEEAFVEKSRKVYRTVQKMKFEQTAHQAQYGRTGTDN